VPAAPGRLDAWPVSTAVNNVRNNGPELVEPLPAE
jgi:putative SOS response-associated peptidase YedK